MKIFLYKGAKITLEEAAAKSMSVRFRTIKQSERAAMSKRRNIRDEISLKQAELAAKREYEL